MLSSVPLSLALLFRVCVVPAYTLESVFPPILIRQTKHRCVHKFIRNANKHTHIHTHIGGTSIILNIAGGVAVYLSCVEGLLGNNS